MGDNGGMLLLLLGMIYFIPTVIALARSHPNGVPIFLINVFLGWTLIGWVAALVWSTTAGPESVRRRTKRNRAG